MKYPNRPEYEKEWRKQNSEKIVEQRTRYYKKNKEQVKKKAHEYYHNTYKHFLKKNYDELFKEKYRLKNQERLIARRALLVELRQQLGGKCSRCSFNAEPRILQFHHHKKDKKDNVTNLQSLKAMREEAAKCILLCPNCHAIEHLTSCTT